MTETDTCSFCGEDIEVPCPQCPPRSNTTTTERAVAHVLMRAGFTRSVRVADQVARDVVRTVRWPHLHWDIDDDHYTPGHLDALAGHTPEERTP